MKWFRRPKNLLGRTLIVEVTLTMDAEGQTKLDVSTLDPNTPVEQVVKALFGAAGALGQRAEQLAEQAKLDVARVLG